MIVKTIRFGELSLTDGEVIHFPQGLVGFPDCKKFVLVDPNDDTLILWLQSLDEPGLVFPVLEPKIFKNDYTVKLSAAELRELQLQNLRQASVFCILTIGTDITQMTANLKAPLVINTGTQTARQVVLQENEHNIKHPMFKELRAHILTVATHTKAQTGESTAAQIGAEKYVALTVRGLPVSSPVMPLHV